ncbi:hypothetical protein GOP47_0005556 [Adiantum capillus-veneris]|uniref:Knottins-like domain-containing protein n=2 Tax=Adiantum capillus-veneris TaxID=13818 RepID=A0A9D4ZNC6_ADICA|nr:hypothetical protein GOP47_0005556 [Adiantum capillus-veneris]
MAATLLVVLVLMVAGVMASARELEAGAAMEKVAAGEMVYEEEEGELEDGVVNVMPEGLCGYQSKTFSGPCVKRRSCAYQCQVVEHAAAGACHIHHVQRHCYCYRYC